MLKLHPDALAVVDLLDRVELLVKIRGLSYLDAIVHLHEREGVDIIAIAEVIKKNPKVKTRIKAEGVRLNMFRK